MICDKGSCFQNYKDRKMNKFKKRRFSILDRSALNGVMAK